MNHITEKSAALRLVSEQEWLAADKAWEARHVCKCTKPVPGPIYLKARECRKCGRRMVADAK